MKKEVLKIDFIDESVDPTKTNENDYIGSVRIPLRDVINNDTIYDLFPVLD